MKEGNSVRIIEVGPRDGLQNESTILSLEVKLEFVKRLLKAGLRTVELTSFVRSDRIPQMSDAVELAKAILPLRKEGISFPCLVPNMKGFEKAREAGVREIALFSATSETFNKKNINMGVDESLDALRPVALEASKSGIVMRGYISTVFGCPYEGKTSPDVMMKVANRMFDFGVYEISFGDTIGCAYPDQVSSVVELLRKSFDLAQVVMHFHDTEGLALANVVAALNQGVSAFDSSVGGLGGCPYAKGATGNLASEDLLNLLNKMGYSTGVDMELLVEASSFISGKLGKEPASKYYHAYKGKRGRIS